MSLRHHCLNNLNLKKSKPPSAFYRSKKKYMGDTAIYNGYNLDIVDFVHAPLNNTVVLCLDDVFVSCMNSL